jgi:hypothetical protein
MAYMASRKYNRQEYTDKERSQHEKYRLAGFFLVSEMQILSSYYFIEYKVDTKVSVNIENNLTNIFAKMVY